MPIDALPPPPQPNDDKGTFNTKAFAWLAALVNFVTQVNAVEAAVDADAAAAAADRALAQTARTGAETARTGAETARDTAWANAQTAAANAGAAAWVSGTSYALGAVVWSPVTRLSYRRTVAGAGTTDPSLDTTNWAALGARPALGRLALINQGVI